ncbi:MAG: hypothetical protein ABJO27_06670 [Pseudoruegeria sp.]
MHGAGSPENLIVDVAVSAMTANLGGRDHGAMNVEKRIVEWVRDMFEFPKTAHGIIVASTPITTIIALKTARDAFLGFESRIGRIGISKLVGYTSAQTHCCVARV